MKGQESHTLRTPTPFYLISFCICCSCLKLYSSKGHWASFFYLNPTIRVARFGCGYATAVLCYCAQQLANTVALFYQFSWYAKSTLTGKFIQH